MSNEIFLSDTISQIIHCGLILKDCLIYDIMFLQLVSIICRRATLGLPKSCIFSSQSLRGEVIVRSRQDPSYNDMWWIVKSLITWVKTVELKASRMLIATRNNSNTKYASLVPLRRAICGRFNSFGSFLRHRPMQECVSTIIILADIFLASGIARTNNVYSNNFF